MPHGVAVEEPDGPTGWQRNEEGQGTQLYPLTSLPGESPALGPGNKELLLTSASPNLSSTCLAPAALASSFGNRGHPSV